MVDARAGAGVDPTDDGEAIAGSVDRDRRSVDRLGRFRGVVTVDDQIRRRIRSFLLDRGIDDHTEVVAPASLYPDHPDCVLTRGRHPHRLNEGPLAGRGGIGRRNDSDPIGTDELDANALASAPGDHGTDDLPGSHVDEPRVDLACPDDRSRRSGGRHARRHRHEHERVF